MDAAKRSTSLSVVSLGVGVIAAVLGIVAIATRPEAPQPREASPPKNDTSSEVAELKRETEQLRLAVSPLSGRLKRLEAQLAERSRGAKDSEETIRKIAMTAMRDEALRSRGRATLPVDGLPEAIKETVTGAFPELQLRNVEMRRTDNGVHYRIRGQYENDTWTMVVDELGEIVEAELPAHSTPESVKVAFNKAIPGAVNEWIDKKRRGGQVVYDVHAKVGGTEYELRFAEDGRMIEAELPLASAPAPALDAAKSAVTGINLTELSAETDEGELVYSFEGRVEQDWYGVTVDAAGNIQLTEMPMSRVPEAVTKAAAKAAPGARLARYASKQVEDGRTIYEIRGGGRGGRGGRGGGGGGGGGGAWTTMRITETGEVVEVEGPGQQNDARGGRREDPPAGDAPNAF